MPSSVLLLLVVAGFGLLVVPALVLRHDFVADRNDSFGVRVLPRRPSADGMDEDDLDDVDEVIDAVEVAETTVEAVEPTGQPEYAEDAEPDEVPAAAPAAVSAAVRRRRVLAVLCALAFAVVFPAALVDARLWVAQAAVDALVVGYLLQARRAVVKARARRRAAERRRYAAEREAVAAEPVEAPEPAAPAGPRYQPLLPVPEHLTAMARQARYGSGVIEQAPAPEPEPEEAPRAVPLRRVANG